MFTRMGAVVAAGLAAWVGLTPAVVESAPIYQFTAIDVPGATRTEVRAINNLGHVAGAYTTADGGVFGFTYDGSMYRTLTYPGATRTEVEGINDLGHVVGHYAVDETSPEGRGGFLFDGSAYTKLSSPTDAGIKPADINNAGTIVGTLGAVGSKGFVLQGGVYSIFEAPNSYATVLTSINNSGLLAGYALYTPYPDPPDGPAFIPVIHSFLSNDAVVEVFSAGSQTEVQGLSDDRRLVGWALVADFPGVPEEFIHLDGEFTKLSLPGAGATVQDINSSGSVAGWYWDAQGVHGFVGHAAPEPTSMVLAAVGLLTIALLRWGLADTTYR